MKMLIFSILLAAQVASAELIGQFPEIDWQVVPTNPICQVVSYPEGTLNRQGEVLQFYPVGSWCTKGDLAANLLRTDTPDFKLLSLIQRAGLKRIRMAYLSFSNGRVAEALCQALKAEVQVEMVLDNQKEVPLALQLQACNPDKFKFYPRGHSKGIGFAHNKISLFESHNSDNLDLVISSGNLTSGTVLLHENWHFVALPKNSFFAQLHECLWSGVIQAGDAAKAYKEFVANCKANVTQPATPAMEVYFIPGEGSAMLSSLREHLLGAEWVVGTSHRFNGSHMRKLMSEVLQKGIRVRMIFDDDMFWAGQLRRDFGLNQRMEAFLVHDLIKLGMTTRYIQTNHGAHLLQHNKFLLWGKGDKVLGAFFGAGNFTSAAFTENFENFYIVQWPEVTEQLNQYYQHLWNNLSTSADKMPVQVDGQN